jgi:hypothetical protein
MSVHPVLAALDAIYVVNLPARADRRAEMAAQLARVGLDLKTAPVRLFAAVRPADAGTFPSLGARGCFLSHLGVLRDAVATLPGTARFAILEDDADFTRSFVADGDVLARALEAAPWDVCYLGHEAAAALPEGPGLLAAVPPGTGLRTTHAMLLTRAAAGRAADYLAAQMARPGGDPAGGPMHVDGSYSWFRRDTPDIRTVATRHQMIVQRASRTDIHATGWREGVPLLGALRRLRNRLARRWSRR